MKIKNLWVNQTTRARWTSYYDVTIPCTLIHLWRHLFTSERLFSAYIKFYHSTSQMYQISSIKATLILCDFCPAIKHSFPKYITDIFSQNCDEIYSSETYFFFILTFNSWSNLTIASGVSKIQLNLMYVQIHKCLSSSNQQIFKFSIISIAY